MLPSKSAYTVSDAYAVNISEDDWLTLSALQNSNMTNPSSMTV